MDKLKEVHNSWVTVKENNRWFEEFCFVAYLKSAPFISILHLFWIFTNLAQAQSDWILSRNGLVKAQN